MPTAGEYKHKKAKKNMSKSQERPPPPPPGPRTATVRKRKVKFKQKLVQFLSRKPKTKLLYESKKFGAEIPFAINFYKRHKDVSNTSDDDIIEDEKELKKRKNTVFIDQAHNVMKRESLPESLGNLSRGRRGRYVYDADPGLPETMKEGTSDVAPMEHVDFKIPTEEDVNDGKLTLKQKRASQLPQNQPKSARRLKQLASGLATKGDKNGTNAKVRGRPATHVYIPWIIYLLSNATTTVLLEAIVCIWAYMYYFAVAYLVSFAVAQNTVEIFLTSGDMYFVADTVFRLCTEIWRYWKEVDYTVLLIPCTLNMWILSLLALAPLDYVVDLVLTATETDSMQALHVSDFFRANRSLYFIRIFIFLGILEKERYLSDFTVFLMKFFVGYLAFIHTVACVYFFLPGVPPLDHILSRPGDRFVNSTNWLALSYENKPGILPSPRAHYVMALNLVTSIVTTVGYGDPAPRNEAEMAVAIFVMLFGAIIIGGLFGSYFTGFLLERDSARTLLFNRLNLIQKKLGQWGSSALFAHKVKEYYVCLWNYREGVYRVDIIRQLPPSMYGDILFDMCAEFFQKAALFRNLEEAFLRAVSLIVEVAIYNPDMIVCLQGERPMAMYFIILGECAVKSKFNTNVTTAILRPGCVFGEASLFLQYPHDVNVETLTACQFLIIRRNKLLEVCGDFPRDWFVMRNRLQRRTQKILSNYELIGKEPIVWVRAKPQTEEQPKTKTFKRSTEYPTIIRWSHGRNVRVERDMDVCEAPVIVEMPCLDQTLARTIDNTKTYGSCVITPVLAVNNKLLHVWHLGILVITFLLALEFSYASSIGGTSEVAVIALTVTESLNYPASVMYFIDLIIEILTSCPVSGLYYKFRDGLRVKRWTFSFYVDLISIFPRITVRIDEDFYKYVIFIHLLIGRVVKLFFKLNRYFNYLDEKYPSAIFMLRLAKTILLFGINVWLAACILFYLACNRPSDDGKGAARLCTGFNWLNSFYIRSLISDGELKLETEAETLANKNALLLSFHFAIATFSSAGFGDFGPHTQIEMVWIIFLQLYGFILVGYVTAKLTSALSCIYLPKVNFEERMVAVWDFCEFHGCSMRLRERLRENYQLEYLYHEGVTLPWNVNYLMYDAPFFFSDDALYAEIGTHLEGVPLFSHADPDKIISIAKLMRRYVLPPDIVFVHRGDVRRHLYIIYSGSVALLKKDTNEVKSILAESGNFGLRDLLFGEPSFNNVKTLSHCVIYALEYEDFEIVFGDEIYMMNAIEETSKQCRVRIEVAVKILQTVGTSRLTRERMPTTIPSWITFPTKKNPYSNVCTYEEFIEPFRGICGGILRLLLMRRTVHPAGSFALFWSLLCAVAGIVVVLINIFELLLQFLSPNFEYPLAVCKIIFIVDVYLRLHWSFYTESNHLVCHPVETASHYLLDGPFVCTIILEVVDYTILPFILNATDFLGNGDGFKWVYKLEVHRLLHLFRMPVIFRFGHNATRYRTFTLLMVYIFLTLVGCTVLACLAIYLTACPWDQTRWMSDFPKKIPACLQGTWIDTKDSLKRHMAYGPQRWLVSTYYVCQTILVIGYGDMITLDESELEFLLFMVTAGFVATRIIISDLTAAVISGDELRGSYLEKMRALEAVMSKQRVNSHVIEKVDEHLQYSWLVSKGLQPQELFSDLHPSLQADLYKEYIGDALSKSPLFYGLSDNILREICTHLKKCYFTRGERIMRRGSLEYEMYVILDGDVWIAGRNTVIQCTLGPGETFGESQMVYGMLRKYSAVAVNNVELFSLNSEGFAETLERYPYVRNHMEERMKGVRADLFERKTEFMREKFFLHEVEQQIASDRVSEQVRRLLAERDIQEGDEYDEDEDRVIDSRHNFVVFIERHIFSWGALDAGLPFFYLAVHPEYSIHFYCHASNGNLDYQHLDFTRRTGRFQIVLHPRCGFHRYFSNLVIWVSILSPATGMYSAVFIEAQNSSLETSPLFIISITFDIIYIFHMLLQFITPYVTINGKYCKIPAKIRYRYFSFGSRFMTDLLSCTPVELFPIFVGDKEYEKYAKYVKYFNLLKALRLVHYYRTLDEGLVKITLTTFRYRVVLSVTTFALLAHTLSCIFYFFAICETQNCKEETWTYHFVQDFLEGDFSPKNLKVWQWYIRSFYWVVTTVSTTGFGDIVATNLTEIALSIVCIFVGAFILAIILSQFISGINSLDKFHREYLYQLKVVVRYLGNLGLSSARQDELLEWFLMRWTLSRGYSFRDTVGILPLTMQINVTMALYHNVIHKVLLFKGMESRFLRCLASQLDHAIYLPGQVIASEGSKGNTLFIVARGRVSGYVLSHKGVPKLVRWYEEGNVFGRLPTFFYDQSYTKSYRAEVVTEILTLTKRSFFYLCRYFYTFERRVQDYITKSYDPTLGAETLFTMEMEKRMSHLIQKFDADAVSAAVANARLQNRGMNTAKPYKDDRKKMKGRRRWGKRRPKLAVSKHKQQLDEQFVESKAKKLLEAFERVEQEKTDFNSPTDTEGATGTESESASAKLGEKSDATVPGDGGGEGPK